MRLSSIRTGTGLLLGCRILESRDAEQGTLVRHGIDGMLALTKTLLQNARSVDQPSDDAMFQAINFEGQGEALFNLLRLCRVDPQLRLGIVRPLFEAELKV